MLRIFEEECQKLRTLAFTGIWKYFGTVLLSRQLHRGEIDY